MEGSGFEQAMLSGSAAAAMPTKGGSDRHHARTRSRCREEDGRPRLRDRGAATGAAQEEGNKGRRSECFVGEDRVGEKTRVGISSPLTGSWITPHLLVATNKLLIFAHPSSNYLTPCRVSASGSKLSAPPKVLILSHSFSILPRRSAVLFSLI
jgi:hypothetical protein